MENAISPMRKINTFFPGAFHKTALDYQQVQEDSAKDALIELAEVDHPSPLQTRPLNLDPWTSSQQQCDVTDAGKPLVHSRRTVHVRGVGEGKCGGSRPFQNDQNLQESIITRLKHILRKLQSPEKQRQDKDKRRRVQYWQETVLKQEKMRRHKEPGIAVEQMAQQIQPKRTSIRIKNSSSEKRRSKLMVRSAMGSLGNSIHENAIRHTMPREKNLDPKDFGEQQVELIKQARRRRTLKNLLF